MQAFQVPDEDGKPFHIKPQPDAEGFVLLCSWLELEPLKTQPTAVKFRSRS